MNDEKKVAAVKICFEEFKKKARDIFTTEGNCAHVAAVFFADSVFPTVIPLGQASVEAGLSPERALRGLIGALQGWGVVIVSEAWMLTEGPGVKHTAGESIANHPDRREVVVVTCEHPFGSEVARASIVRGGGAPQLGAWVTGKSDGGRLVGLVRNKKAN